MTMNPAAYVQIYVVYRYIYTDLAKSAPPQPILPVLPNCKILVYVVLCCTTLTRVKTRFVLLALMLSAMVA